MKIQIEIRRPRWLPDRLRWRTRLAVGMVLSLAVGVPVAWASHDFGDVPTSHQFHSQISAIKGAGITTGCGGGNYCPDDLVRRDAMAAFMHRGFSRAAEGSADSTLITAATTELGVITITVPGAAGGTQFVKLDAAVTAVIQSNTGCPCTTGFRIAQDGVGGISLYRFITNDGVGSGGAHLESAGATAVVPVPTGTTQTFRILAVRAVNTGGTVTGYGELTAVTAAFGSTGGSTLSTASVRVQGPAAGER